MIVYLFVGLDRDKTVTMEDHLQRLPDPLPISVRKVNVSLQFWRQVLRPGTVAF